jgi:hypothetical protein
MKKERYLSYCSMAIGLGLMMGPVMGSLLYSWLDFKGTFYFFGALLSIIFLITILMIP